MAVKHTKVATTADDGTSEVGTNEWNDNHTIDNSTITNDHLAGSIANGKLATDPLARANHTGSQAASTVSDFDTEVANNSAVAANTAKTGITTSQASAIVANTAKTGITTSQASAITANTAKVGLTNNSVDSDHYVDGSIDDAHLSSGITVDAKNVKHTVTTSGTDIDFNEVQVQTISIAASTTFTTTNRASGLSKTIRIITDGTTRSLAFPSDWKFVGTKPTEQAASKTGILTVTNFGTTDAYIVAAYAVEA
tara:strand:- start:818 stop:1576 length:759 start_codon:yes stop_codon:yes gene_type:complete